MHVMLILQEFHVSQVSVTGRRDKVHPKRDKDQRHSLNEVGFLCLICFSDTESLLPFSQVLELVWENRYPIHASVIMDPLKDLLMTFQAL